MKKTLEWTHPALHLVQKALVAAVAIIAAVGLFALPVTALAENTSLDAPVHHKTATLNSDGTIDITLNVTGNSIQHSETSQADVIVVMDLSSSMTQTNSGQTRLQVAKNAVNSLAQKLLSNNTATNPDAVHLSLVTFGGAAATRLQDTKSLSDFQSTVNGLSAYSGRTAAGGTNWEDALATANGVATRDGASVYIIFVSDGNPTYRDTRGGSWYDWYYDNTGEYDSDRIDSKTIYGTGNSDNNGLNYQYAAAAAKSINDAGKTLYSVGVFGDVDNMQNLATAAGQANNYYSATDSAALNRAFDNIVNDITTDVSYTGVSITDTINSDAVEFALPDGSATDSPTFTYTKDGENWSDAPKATVSGGNVSWNLSSVGTLATGVTYSVSFKVRLTQAAYDAAANATGDYSVFTNSNSGLTYSVITTVNGSSTTADPATAYYEKPQVVVPTSTLHITKSWFGGTIPPSLTVQVLQDGNDYKSVELNEANKWSADVKVAAGPIGHTYSVNENATDEWAETLPGAVKLTGLTSQDGTQKITNTYKTGTLSLTKNVKGNAANTDEDFTFTLTCKDLAGKSFGDITFDADGKTTVILKNGGSKMVEGLPAGKTISIAETTSDGNSAKTTTTTTVKVDNVTKVDEKTQTSVDAPIEYGKTTSVTYTNKTEIAPNTGLDISTTSQGVLLGVAAAGAATLAAAAIRKNHGERKEK